MDPFSKRNEQNSAAAAITQFNENAESSGNFEIYINQLF